MKMTPTPPPRDAEMQIPGFRLVGRSTPCGPGDIYVSEAAIAQLGGAAVRREVRGIYRAAYGAKR